MVSKENIPEIAAIPVIDSKQALENAFLSQIVDELNICSLIWLMDY